MEQVSHTTHVFLAFQRVFSLGNKPHSLGHNGVQACVLKNNLHIKTLTEVQVLGICAINLSIFRYYKL